MAFLYVVGSFTFLELFCIVFYLCFFGMFEILILGRSMALSVLKISKCVAPMTLEGVPESIFRALRDRTGRLHGSADDRYEATPRGAMSTGIASKPFPTLVTFGG